MTATCTTYYHHTDLNATSGALTHRYYVRDYLGSTRAVVDESGNVLQSTAYYPSGVPLTPNSLTPQTIKLHTGKDFFDLQGAGWYDNQARYYDCLIPTFKSQDPLAEKYPWLSPYNHCANNPLRYTDYNGMDYDENISDSSIVVSAVILATDVDYNEAVASANIINNQSGLWSYNLNIEENGENKEYSLIINFDISVIKIENPNRYSKKSILNSSMINYLENRTNVNAFEIVSGDFEDALTNGKTIGGYFIQVKSSRCETETGAHEIGHILGAGHTTSGLMTAESSDINRSYKLSKSSLNEIIRNPIKNKRTRSAGKGNLYNNSRFPNSILKKGKIIKIKR